ncbi:MAG: phosphoglycerate kinase [Bacillota bacterium]|nr:phosphoglycerate kinase [Bacillota bacterium]
MNKKTVRDVDVRGKKALVRVDFNVPQAKTGEITDDSRIRAALPTIRYLLDNGAAAILMSHLGRPKGKTAPEFSLRRVASRLEELLSVPVRLAPAVRGPEVARMVREVGPGQVLMLENTRFEPGEEKNDPTLAKELASYGDVFVNDAFGAAHRAHATTAGIAAHIPAVAGLLMQKEIEALGGILHAPERPFVAIIGGAKIAEKIQVLESLTERVDTLLIGGGMSNTFMASLGRPMANTPVESDKFDEARRIVAAAASRGVTLELPTDMVCADAFSETANVRTINGPVPDGWMALDIGPESQENFSRYIRKAATVFWNGPVGVFEMAPFRGGTDAVARAVAECGGMTVVGGGDSLAAVEQAGVADRIKHLSTGGGASLEFMEGKTLPGVAALLDK